MTDNQINKLPKNWESKKLEDLISYAIGGDWGKDENYQDADYDFAYCIRGSELKNWKEDKGKSASLRKIKKSNIVKRKLQVGDILVEISGGGPEQPVGRTVVIDQFVLDFEAHIVKICTNFFRLVRPIDNVDSIFLNFYLTFFYFSGEIGKFQSGSNNLRNLKFPDYLKIQIPLPPLPEQQKIVQKIESLFTELETGTKALKNALEQLKIYRQAVLNHFLTNDKWQVVKGESLFEYITSGSRGWADYYSEEGAIFLRITNLNFNTFLLDLRENKIQRVNLLNVKEGLRTKVQEGDFLISITGYLGMFAIVPHDFPEAYVNQHIALCRPKTGFDKKFVGYFITAKNGGLKQFNDMQKGATKAGLSLSDIRNLQIPLPSLEIQTQIVSEIEKRMAGADALEASLKAQLINAENLRQSILKRAFEGKLV